MLVAYIQNGQELATHVVAPGERVDLPRCDRTVNRCEYLSARMDGSGNETGLTLGTYGEYGAGTPATVESYSWSDGFGGGFSQTADGVAYVNSGSAPVQVVHQEGHSFIAHTVAPGQLLLLPVCPTGLVNCSYTTGTGSVGAQGSSGNYLPTAGTFVNGTQPAWHLDTGYGNDFHPTPDGVLYTNSSSEAVSVMFTDNFGSQILTRAAPGQTVSLPLCVGLRNECSYAAAVAGGDKRLLSSAEVKNSVEAAGEVIVDPGTPTVPAAPSVPPRPMPKPPGKPRADNIFDVVLGNLGAGVSLGGLGHDILSYLSKSPASRLGTAASGVGVGLGLYDVARGSQEKDDGRALGGAIDVWAGVVGVTVSARLGIAASIAKMYGQWWAPLGAKEQTEFLNKMAQCKFKKNTNDLLPSQAQYFVNRYSGVMGFGNMLGDYSSSHWPKSFWSC